MLSEETRREIRKTIIRLAEKHQKPGTGSSLDFLRRRTAVATWPDLTPLLGAIRWATVGAVATRHYMPERRTQDMDAAVLAADAQEARHRLASAGWHYDGELSIAGSSWRTPEGVELDVLELSDPWAPDALTQAQGNRDLQGLPVMPLPFLILMKYRASRAVDLGDLTRMLGQASDEQLESVRAIFRRYLSEELEDLESLIRLGKLEMEGR